MRIERKNTNQYFLLNGKIRLCSVPGPRFSWIHSMYGSEVEWGEGCRDAHCRTLHQESRRGQPCPACGTGRRGPRGSPHEPQCTVAVHRSVLLVTYDGGQTGCSPGLMGQLGHVLRWWRELVCVCATMLLAAPKRCLFLVSPTELPHLPYLACPASLPLPTSCCIPEPTSVALRVMDSGESSLDQDVGSQDPN